MDTVHDIPDDPKQREAFFRVLMEAAYDGILITQDGVIIEVSRALLDASGYSGDELIGRPVIDFVAEEFRDGIRQWQIDEAEGRFEAVAVAKGGRQLIVEIVTRQVVIRGRQTRISALRDVTEKRRLETQLYQAHKMEALGRLASGIAHDFNNILTVVRSYSESLVEKLAHPDRADALEILRAADTGAALTRQLLAFSRPQMPKPTVVNLNVVVNESQEMLRRLMGQHIEVVIELAPDLEAVNADRWQMQQVLLNLAINAHDAMPKGGGMTLRTRNVEVAEGQTLGDVLARPGRYVMLAVSDSGTGMSDEVKAQIFEPFFTTKAPGRGTGLGLAIVRGIVDRSKGFILVDSTLGVGSTFAIYLPAVSH